LVCQERYFITERESLWKEGVEEEKEGRGKEGGKGRKREGKRKEYILLPSLFRKKTVKPDVMWVLCCGAICELHFHLDEYF
jgi:hypothetical protein